MKKLLLLTIMGIAIVGVTVFSIGGSFAASTSAQTAGILSFETDPGRFDVTYANPDGGKFYGTYIKWSTSGVNYCTLTTSLGSAWATLPFNFHRGYGDYSVPLSSQQFEGEGGGLNTNFHYYVTPRSGWAPLGYAMTPSEGPLPNQVLTLTCDGISKSVAIGQPISPLPPTNFVVSALPYQSPPDSTDDVRLHFSWDWNGDASVYYNVGFPIEYVPYSGSGSCDAQTWPTLNHPQQQQGGFTTSNSYTGAWNIAHFFPGTPYCARIQATGYMSNSLIENYHDSTWVYSSLGPVSTVKTGSPPPAPVLSAKPISDSQINVQWAPVATADTYKLSVVSPLSPGLIFDKVSSPYNSTGLSSGTTYTYKAKSINAYGESDWSALVSATTYTGTCPTCNNPTGIDIGLRIFSGGGVVKLAAEPFGTITSPLRIARDGVVYGLMLVSTSDVTNASGVRVNTKNGVMAVKKLP